jgi:L-rhamnose mutarotase
MYRKISVFTLSATMAIISCLGLMGCESKHQPQQADTLLKPVAQPANVLRFGMVTGLKPEKMAYYKQLHAHAWPAVLKKIKECNIRDYSIYLQKIDGKYFLFSYFEYTGADFKADMATMASHGPSVPHQLVAPLLFYCRVFKKITSALYNY